MLLMILYTSCNLMNRLLPLIDSSVSFDRMDCVQVLRFAPRIASF